ncbi:MAG: ATPase [Streptosporangiales bacterium]|nr:ATPase [Streptosporangiales bacterium]
MTMTSSGTAVVTLPTDTQILITREFAAPRHLVYRAWTTPELIRRWWSGGMGKVTVVDVDLRPGGTWRHVMVTDEGLEVGFHGEYREVVPNELIVCTEVFEGMPDGADEPAVCTYTFTEQDGRTTVTLLTEVATREVRDMILDSGMETGMQAGWDLVEQIAISLR